MSTTVYSQVLIYTAESTGTTMERTKMPNLRNGSKGGFEPGLTRLRVRHSTTELPRSIKKPECKVQMVLHISTYSLWSLGVSFSIISLRFFIRALVVDDIFGFVCFLVCLTMLNELFGSLQSCSYLDCPCRHVLLAL